MQSFLTLLNVVALCMSTIVQVTLVRECAGRSLIVELIMLITYRIRMLRLTSGSAASSYIMNRFKTQDIKNEPFLGFHSGFFGKHDDLTGVGGGVGSDEGKQVPLRAVAVLIASQARQDHQVSRSQAPLTFDKPFGGTRKLALMGTVYRRYVSGKSMIPAIDLSSDDS